MNFTQAQMQEVEGAISAFGGPLGLVGRAVGFGPDELDAGVPWWGWLTIGLVVGGAATYVFRDKIEKVIPG